MSGKDMFIRRIAALDTIEEVVGRAAEMGLSTLSYSWRPVGA